MNDRDFQLIMKAKRQIQRESAIRSVLIFSLLFVACLRFLGIETPFLYLTFFMLLFISLVLSSDLIANLGTVSKAELVGVIEKHIHSEPEMLTRYCNAKART
ncbi:MAG: hypothetical protein QGG67_08305 [Gammaproteobacteria bacterium]|jgi:hypothetical protein|nr:hypothetical protein [Gammaproteobacteria bacterium]HJO11263.1 hypothetical protein [Gammaproteobacteria bacterium]|tara:strand:- start:237 stop:542 length:306 start_codon:yes stop_codon:yes gene_type:complete